MKDRVLRLLCSRCAMAQTDGMVVLRESVCRSGPGLTQRAEVSITVFCGRGSDRIRSLRCLVGRWRAKE